MSLQLLNVSLNYTVLPVNSCCIQPNASEPILRYNVNNYLDRHQSVPTNMLHNQGQLPEYLFKLNDKISKVATVNDEPRTNKVTQVNKQSHFNALLKSSDNHSTGHTSTASRERQWQKTKRRRRKKRNADVTNRSFITTTNTSSTTTTYPTNLTKDNSTTSLDANSNNNASSTIHVADASKLEQKKVVIETTTLASQNDGSSTLATTTTTTTIVDDTFSGENSDQAAIAGGSNNFSESMDIISSDEILSSSQEPHHNGNGKIEGLQEYSGNRSSSDNSGYNNSNVIRIHPRMIIRLMGISMMAATLMTVVTCFVCKRCLKCKNSTCCCCLRLYNSSTIDQDSDDDHPSSTGITYEHPLNGCYRNGLNSSARRRDPYAICPYQLIFNRNNSQRPPPLYSSSSSQVVNINEQLLVPDQTSDQQRTQVQASNFYILNGENGSQTGLMDHQQQHQPQLYCSGRNGAQRQQYPNSPTSDQLSQQNASMCYNVILENLELNHLYDPMATYNTNNNCDIQTNYHAGQQQQQQYAVTSSDSICNQQQQQQQLSRLAGCDQSSSASSNPSLWANVNILSSSALTKARLLSAEDLLNLAKITEIPIIIAASDEPPQVILSKFNQLKSSLAQQQQQPQQQQTINEVNVDEPRFCLLAPSSNLSSSSAPITTRQAACELIEDSASDRPPMSSNCQAIEPYLRVRPMLDPPPPYSNINLSTANNIVKKFVTQSSDHHENNDNNPARSSISPSATCINCSDRTVTTCDSGLDTGNDTGTDETVETSGTIPPATSSDSGLTSGDEIMSETAGSRNQNCNTGQYFSALSETK